MSSSASGWTSEWGEALLIWLPESGCVSLANSPFECLTCLITSFYPFTWNSNNQEITQIYSTGIDQKHTFNKCIKTTRQNLAALTSKCSARLRLQFLPDAPLELVFLTVRIRRNISPKIRRRNFDLFKNHTRFRLTSSSKPLDSASTSQ